MKIGFRDQKQRLIHFFWIGFLLVFILNIFVWLYVDQVENKFQAELEDKLIALGKLTTRLIDDNEISLIIPGEQTTIEYLYYQQLLEDILLENDLQNLILLSPDMEILIAIPEIVTGKTTINLKDNEFFRKAMKGQPSASGVQAFSGEHFMSAFSPVLNIDGFVTAILFLEAPAGYFSVLSTLRTRIIIFSTINLILLMIFALILLKIIRKTLEYQTKIKDEEHLVQLGFMAANVAHELRNPLNIIEGTNDIIRKKYAQNNDELFGYIPDEVKRLSILIDNFLKFSRTPEINPETKSIKAFISRLEIMTGNQSNHVIFRRPHSTFEFTTDYNILEQAMLNLIINAIHATEQKGKVEISIQKGQSGRLTCHVYDEGCGIQPEILTKIFDPFFTTKEKGTGLGLAITKRLIEHLDGELSVNSEYGKSTTFTIKIPELKIQNA